MYILWNVSRDKRSFVFLVFFLWKVLGPVVQSPISTNPWLTLNKTYRVNPGLVLIRLWITGPWNEFENYWLLVSGTHFTPTLQNVIVGKFDLDSDSREQKLPNYLILLGKLHLWNSRKSNMKPKMSSFTDLVRQKHMTEQYIGEKNNYIWERIREEMGLDLKIILNGLNIWNDKKWTGGEVLSIKHY